MKNKETGVMYKFDNYNKDTLSMMLNMAYEPLGYTTADEYREYCKNKGWRSAKNNRQ